MRVLILTTLTLALGLCSGCGALEELEAGNKIMDQHAGRLPGGKNHKPPEAEPEPDPRPAPPGVKPRSGPSAMEKLLAWAEKKLEGPPPPPDPDDAVVRCWVGRHEHFTTRRDCISRGGRSHELPPVK